MASPSLQFVQPTDGHQSITNKHTISSCMEHKYEDWTQCGGWGGQGRLLINDNCRQVIIQLKFKVLSRMHSVKTKEEASFQEKERTVQKLVVKNE